MWNTCTRSYRKAGGSATMIFRFDRIDQAIEVLKAKNIPIIPADRSTVSEEEMPWKVPTFKWGLFLCLKQSIGEARPFVGGTSFIAFPHIKNAARN